MLWNVFEKLKVQFLRYSFPNTLKVFPDYDCLLLNFWMVELLADKTVNSLCTVLSFCMCLLSSLYLAEYSKWNFGTSPNPSLLSIAEQCWRAPLPALWEVSSLLQSWLCSVEPFFLHFTLQNTLLLHCRHLVLPVFLHTTHTDIFTRLQLVFSPV